MTHYADLKPCAYFGLDYAFGLLSVGWLGKDHQYNRGPVSPQFTSALTSLLMDPWQPFTFMGFHRCEFCRLTGGPSTFPTIAGTEIMLGCNNLYIPGDHFLYVAPSTIIHYIDAHEYAPPEAFQVAVLNCPEMRFMSYLKLIREKAPRGFLTQLRTSNISMATAHPTQNVAEQRDAPKSPVGREFES
jgi:hypothetical protein